MQCLIPAGLVNMRPASRHTFLGCILLLLAVIDSIADSVPCFGQALPTDSVSGEQRTDSLAVLREVLVHWNTTRRRQCSSSVPPYDGGGGGPDAPAKLATLPGL